MSACILGNVLFCTQPRLCNVLVARFPWFCHVLSLPEAYLSCNLAWRFLVYRKSSPEGFEENIFSLCSMIEPGSHRLVQVDFKVCFHKIESKKK